MLYRPRFLILTLVGFLIVIGESFFRRTIPVLLCGIFSFNSLSCGGSLLGIDRANATSNSVTNSTITFTQPQSIEDSNEGVKTPEKTAICLPIIGCINEKNVIEKVLQREIQNALLNVFKDDIPVAISTDNLYPTTKKLPGGAFQPQGSPLQPEDSILSVFQQMLQVAPDGSLQLIPGDYAAKVYLYCFKPNAPGIPTHEYRSPSGHRYLLAPVKGKMADVVRAINIQALGSGVPNSLINVLVWNIQVGVKYQDMSPEVRNLVDTLIPEYRERLSYSFFEKLVSTWNSFSKVHRGLPSFSESLDKLGDAGQAIKATIAVRERLIRHGVNYFALSNDFIIPVSSDETERFTDVPWSRINERLFARMVTKNRTAEAGVLQIRVLPEQGTQNSRLPIFVETLEGLKAPGVIEIPASQTTLSSYGDQQIYTAIKQSKPDEQRLALFVVNPSDLAAGAQIQGKLYKPLSRRALSVLLRLGLKAVPFIGWGSVILDLYDLYQWVAIPETHPDYKIQPAGAGDYDKGTIPDSLPVDGADIAQALCNRKRGRILKGKISAAIDAGINRLCNVADDTPRKRSGGNGGDSNRNDGRNNNRNNRDERGKKAASDRESLLSELKRAGIKHDPDNIIDIRRTTDGKIVFLEKGNSQAGLQHIIEKHVDDFARTGISSDKISDLVMKAVTEGKIVGYQGRGTGRPIYEVVFNGQKQKIAVTVGSNGFIVGANPVTGL